ncbi:glycerophosphodiester phosphodiesterase [Staphylococcus simiae]|uniref:glycerophosphodiester phosphodiesterase n=1 Tax=Staphylococcus simiae TaxID=308354 RepID=UPI001A9600AB|nr:glycerophosphodiester phosphodiesterase [Staphylococcus simiae]MBO1198610.1 glycerophosphodiester phosphodiesterase [Staphylococcus simiae]MBO1200778.1 glycerophosphodiester phosphodiesterase [Staphylococcus simiae]MBO1202986.1 glycerophosphodiester phosphodiesterase [Staphylococcus simiae]MBO1210663.1 glycerophosphodiester phosphodiesterase [Staphylococcus simiae]MBO1229114.1 glycerophosphodiester phosphodiesterase [Staphylococcus simiae]
MKKLNRFVLNTSILTAGLLSSLLVVMQRQTTQHKQTIPAFFNGQAPYIFAHRGGMALKPEQTKLAFDNAVKFGVDGFETDVRLTKDQQLIVFHDATVDRTTNGSGKVSEHTLAELKKLDAGYHFKDINGATPYRAHKDTSILTFDELLQMYPNMYINVDLKDAPDSFEGSIAPQIMFDIITSNHAEDRVLVTSFYRQQIARFNKIANGHIAIGASQQEVTEAFLKFHLFLGKSYLPQANTFQMPTSFNGINLTSRRFINWLNDLNIVPGFYGVNSVDLMKDLYHKGVHTLVTDRPDLAQQFKSTLGVKQK